MLRRWRERKNLVKIIKKTMSELLALSVSENSRRHFGIPTQNQKMYQKSMVKNSMRFRAQNRHGKITKNVKNVAKKWKGWSNFLTTCSGPLSAHRNRGSRGQIRHSNSSPRRRTKLNLHSNIDLAVNRHVDLDLELENQLHLSSKFTPRRSAGETANIECADQERWANAPSNNAGRWKWRRTNDLAGNIRFATECEARA